MTEESQFTRKFRKELMAGLSSLVLLAVLARAGREMYGYEIAKAVKAEGEGGLIFKQGAIYPVLRSLNATGLLKSRVEASAFGPPRRYYDITDPPVKGAKTASLPPKVERAALDPELQEALNAPPLKQYDKSLSLETIPADEPKLPGEAPAAPASPRDNFSFKTSTLFFGSSLGSASAAVMEPAAIMQAAGTAQYC